MFVLLVEEIANFMASFRFIDAAKTVQVRFCGSFDVNLLSASEGPFFVAFLYKKNEARQTPQKLAAVLEGC